MVFHPAHVREEDTKSCNTVDVKFVCEKKILLSFCITFINFFVNRPPDKIHEGTIEFYSIDVFRNFRI